MTNNGWYAIKPSQTKPNQTKLQKQERNQNSLKTDSVISIVNFSNEYWRHFKCIQSEKLPWR